MTDFGFITGCVILAVGIWTSGYYINRAIQVAASWLAKALSVKV